MKKDLENLAKEMQKLEHEDRLYWLQSMGHCREIAHPSTYPTYKTLNQIGADFRHFKNTLIESLSGILTGKNEESPVIKNGVDAFMSLTKEEREEFYTVVLKGIPCKVATKTSCNSSVSVKTRTHE